MSDEAVLKAARVLYEDAGVDDIDPRLKYVYLQVGREVWESFLESFGDADDRWHNQIGDWCEQRNE